MSWLDMSGQRLIYIGNVKHVPPGESKKFFYPVGDVKGTRRPGLLIHLEEGFVAYDGLCTHMQAEIEWNQYLFIVAEIKRWRDFN